MGERSECGLEGGYRCEGAGGFPGTLSARLARPEVEHAGKAKHKPAQSQMNARIDADLKATGDAALAAAGLTPTQAVRMLWSLAVRYQGEPEKLRAALDPDSAEPSADELAERWRKAEEMAAAGLTCPIAPGEAMIREVHVYGMAARVGEAGGEAQHHGLGRRLVERACTIARAAGYMRVNVISAVGTRAYYRRLGFVDGDLYQCRDLAVAPERRGDSHEHA